MLGRALADLGHDPVVVMAADYEPRTRDEGVECVYLRSRLKRPFSPALIPYTPGLLSFLREGGFDAVLCSELFQMSTVLAAMARGRAGFRLYVWQEMGAHQRMAGGTVSRLYHATLGRWVIGRVSGFFPRAAQSELFLQEVGVPRERIGPVIPNGADGLVFRPGGRRSKEPLVACVGTLVPVKQPDIALEAFAAVVKAEPQARLLIKGAGPMEESLRACVHALKLDGMVEIDTARSSHEVMADLYRRAWVGVYPAKVEGAPLSPAEMVMCGTPVVVSKKMYHSKALQRFGGAEVTGFDVDEVAAAVLRCITAVRTGAWNAEAQAASVAGEYSSLTMASRLVEYDSKFSGERL